MHEDVVGLQFAKQIVRFGWDVVPGFCTKEGVKLPLAGGNWVQKATKDKEKLEAWWTARPWMWPGTVSGVGSSLVFDLDGEEAINWFRNLISRVGWQNGGLVYKTPGRAEQGGGLHVIFSWPTFLSPDFGQAKVRLDGGEAQLRGRGCWTLLAGARRPDCGGREYEILEVPDKEPAAQAPQGLVEGFIEAAGELVQFGSTGTGEIKQTSPEEAWALGQITDGRKNRLASLAWWLCLRTCYDEAMSECLRFNRECCVPPLSDGVVEQKVNYAFKRAQQYKQRNQQQITDIQRIYSKFR